MPAAVGAAEFPRPEMVTELSGPAVADPVVSVIPANPVSPAALDALPVLPRRRRAIAEPTARRDSAERAGTERAGTERAGTERAGTERAGAVDSSAGDAGVTGADPGPAAIPARPDLNVLAQVLEGLRRMA